MPQSLGQIYLHTVFATTNREPLIIRPEPTRLHAYLVDVLAELGCPALATGGIEDHVHILYSLGRTHSVAWVMEKVKSGSSRWMKQQGALAFWWQPGYAAFSVSRSDLDRLKRYLHGQREHHREHPSSTSCGSCAAANPLMSPHSRISTFLSPAPQGRHSPARGEAPGNRGDADRIPRIHPHALEKTYNTQ